jgi:eukaryotic-like serine/threonine-protein kinase
MERSGRFPSSTSGKSKRTPVPVETNILPPRYRGAKKIGRGGMGDIYRATDEALGRAVAVKVLADHYAQDESVRGRFSREALAAARLSGRPHVITIFDVGEWEDRPYIVMEYLAGGSLADVVSKRGPAAPAEAVEWLEQAGVALDAAHAEGVVHRDVKPANLLLDRDGNVHVADFGVASAAGLDSMTQTGTILGTAGYLSPEQAQGEPATPASDRYGLAVLAFELLTGERPYQGDSPAAEASAHIHAPIPSISARRPDLPRELDDVFERGLAKDPTARYASAAEFVADLRHALHESAGSTAIVPPAPAAPPPDFGPPPAAPRPQSPLIDRRPPWLLPALVLLLLVGLGIVGALLLAGGDDGSTARATTIARTVTAPGTTQRVEVTVTEPAATQPPAEDQGNEPPAAGNLSIAQARALQDESTAAMRNGDWENALALAQRALARLRGTGDIYEGYANYNVGRSLIELGNCAEGLPYIDRSEQIQGPRGEFAQARAKC